MDLHAKFIRNVIGPLWARWERSPYLKHLPVLQQTQFHDLATIQARQLKLLQSLIKHAYATAPFYRERLDRQGIRPESIRDLSDITRLPLLSKADLREAGGSLLSNEYSRDQLRLKKTSGSTGVAVHVYVDEEAQQFKRACTLRSDQWSGWRFGEPVAMVWGNPEYRKRGWRGRLRNALLERATYLDTLKMDTTALANFAQTLLSHPPSLLFGHAHSVYLFAEYVRKEAIEGVRPRGIITTAMVLHGWQRRAIEEVFGCKVTNRYGCEEVSLIACECEKHEGLHVNADGVYVEILNEGRPARPGEAGSIVVTDLTNRAMPIIRYQVGDVAVWADRPCSCGRGLPLLERLEGREADYVVTQTGELISGISLTENFALHVTGLAQLQIVQDTLNRFRFRIVRGHEFGADSIRRIAQLVAERFGIGTTFECEFVDEIPQEPSGKYRFCISHVENPFTGRREALAS
ncbi:MAG TPA: phenylacetate--CoA ligase family protein [Gemmataceae bacterium]|nr:phenylacetate--CoA ligase family protein [Gemmataceae bacterium]